jgi:toxin HigB-1
VIDAKSIKHKGLADLYETGKTGKVESTLVQRVRQRMGVLDSVDDIKDAANAFQSLRIHELTGKRRGTWSLSVNGPWRLTFKFRNGNVYDLDLEQYH